MGPQTAGFELGLNRFSELCLELFYQENPQENPQYSSEQNR